MSLMTMRRKMASKKTASIILWILIVVFAASIALWGIPRNSINGKGGTSSPTDMKDAAFSVNGVKVTCREMDDLFAHQNALFGTPTIQQAVAKRRANFQDGVNRALELHALGLVHVSASDWDFRKLARQAAYVQLFKMREEANKEAKDAAAAAKTPEQRKQLQSANQRLADSIRTMVKNEAGKEMVNPTGADFLRWFENDFLMSKTRTGVYDQFSDQARGILLGGALAKQLPVDPFTEDFLKRLATREVQVSWIFIPTEKFSVDGLNAAKTKATKIYNDIVHNPKSFADQAKKYSQDPQSNTNGGSLDWVNASSPKFGGSGMLEYTVFSLKPGQLSPVTMVGIPTRTGPVLGYAIVRVDNDRYNQSLSSDYHWSTERPMELISQRHQLAVAIAQDYIGYQRLKANVVCYTPEYQAYLDSYNGKYNEANDALMKVLDQPRLVPPAVYAAISYMASFLDKDPKQKIVHLEAAQPYCPKDDINLYESLGTAYLQTGQPQRAHDQYKLISEAILRMDYPHFAPIWYEKLQGEMKQAGAQEYIPVINKWLETHPYATPPKK